MAANYLAFFETAKSIRGGRDIWYKDGNGEQRHNVPLGGTIANPFTGFGCAFAGDLVEVKLGEQYLLFKSFKIVTASEANATSIVLNGDGYSTAPEVGNILIKAGDDANAIGLICTITAVNYDATNKKFTCTIDKAIGALSVGDILVEAIALDANAADIVVDKVSATAPATATTGEKYLNTADGKLYTATATDTWGTGVALADGKYVFNMDDSSIYTLVSETVTEVSAGTPLVKNPNTFLEADVDFIPTVGYGLTNVTEAISTVFGKMAYVNKMQPLPGYVLKKNRSYIDGIFWI